jgi:hypothetical protein
VNVSSSVNVTLTFSPSSGRGLSSASAAAPSGTSTHVTTRLQRVRGLQPIPTSFAAASSRRRVRSG